VRWLLVAVAGSVAVLATAAAASWWWMTRPGPDTEVVLEVPRGQPLTATLHDLEASGLVPSAKLGRLYTILWHESPAPHWGRYRFPPRTSAVDAIDRVLRGVVATIAVTIPEGSRSDEVARLMIDAGIGSSSDWTAALADTGPVASCATEVSSLEGFLFPDTYRFAPGVTARVAVQHLVDRFLEVWREESAAAEPLWGSCLEIVTLASLVEAETSVDGERRLIAGVFVNRLERSMLLQCDPTVIFALRRHNRWTGRLLRRHWKLDDPYNTYQHPGLPPGPINSPGRAAIAAALAPADTEHLFFVASPDGGHTFSRTLREHNRAVARLRRARR
jgi:UPF0755 protein